MNKSIRKITVSSDKGIKHYNFDVDSPDYKFSVKRDEYSENGIQLIFTVKNEKILIVVITKDYYNNHSICINEMFTGIVCDSVGYPSTDIYIDLKDNEKIYYSENYCLTEISINCGCNAEYDKFYEVK